MKSSYARYAALVVVLAGIAVIVWTAVANPDTAPTFAEAADPPSTQSSPAIPSGGGAAPEARAEGTSAPSPPTISPAATTTTQPPEPIPVLGTAFTLSRLDGWLNTDATSLEEIRERNTLTVVQFWTFGCRNCKKTLDALGQLHADFRDRGVEVVGVHSPEFAYEADVDNIVEAAAELGVVWPIALDTTKYNFHHWQEGPTGYWPRVYIIDSENQIRFDRRGDGAHTYRELYATVKRLLARESA
ncbi:redoxin domain-containing protein [Candidatus Poriferisodalis sp.]|uniref:redoxin domain-containing protein n=1 Tax=Candidatus Poriferisodalis sp. TaxID=3101277 RepID=UPI003B01AB30